MVQGMRPCLAHCSFLITLFATSLCCLSPRSAYICRSLLSCHLWVRSEEEMRLALLVVRTREVEGELSEVEVMRLKAPVGPGKPLCLKSVLEHHVGVVA